MSTVSRQLAIYRHFNAAVARDAMAEARTCVSETFHAILPGVGRVPFGDFEQEVRRQRAAFSDFGQQRSEERVVEQERDLVVYHRSAMTFDGPLTNWLGRTVPPTGNRVVISAVDLVRFEASGRIVELRVMSDRLDTVDQMML